MMAGDARPPQGEGTREMRVAPPALIALGGALTAGLCLLLLLGPFYEDYAAPADRLRMWLLLQLDGRGPIVLQRLVWERFTPLLVLLFATVLILLPWRRAVRLQRRRGPARASQEPPGVAEETAPRGARHGEPASPRTGGEETIRHSTAELGEMARSAGVPWRPDYATEGGARGLLEVLRVLESGPGPTAESAPPPAPAPAAADVPRGPAEESSAPDAEDLSGGYDITGHTWSPSYSASVYTSTVLYGAEPEEVEAPRDQVREDEIQQDGEGER